MLDVDTPEDLDALIVVLEGQRRVAPRTRGSILQLGRMAGSGMSAAADRLRGAVTGGSQAP